MRIAAAGLVALVVFLVSPVAASAHGNLDQYLEGDGGCNTFNFPASVTGAGGQRQTFVPSGGQLSAVGLCVSSPSVGSPLQIVIRDGGGGVVGGGTSLQSTPPETLGATPAYVHVDFLQPIAVTPGGTYTIEIGAGTPVTWYGSNPGMDLYCAGVPNSSAVGDFAFRAYLVSAAGGPSSCPPATATPAPQPTPTHTAVQQAGTTPTVAPGATATPVAGGPATDTGDAPVASGGDGLPSGTGAGPSGVVAGAGSTEGGSAPGPSGLPVAGVRAVEQRGMAVFVVPLVVLGALMWAASVVVAGRRAG